jgi:DnaK suppressor protein
MSKKPAAKADKAKVPPKKVPAKQTSAAKPAAGKNVAKAAPKSEPAKPQPKAADLKGTPAKATKGLVAVTEATPAPSRTVAATKPLAPKKTEGLKSKMAGRTKLSDVVLPPGYTPSEDEPFMNEKHRAYFRKRLLDWKDEILRQTRETLAILHEDSTQHADLADRATSETDRATELRTRDRQRKLIAKIDAAIARIEDGSYGYCEDTGEPIGLKRLDARPIATLSVEAQERHERREKVYREE